MRPFQNMIRESFVLVQTIIGGLENYERGYVPASRAIKDIRTLKMRASARITQDTQPVFISAELLPDKSYWHGHRPLD
jgi:hypothetical protein